MKPKLRFEMRFAMLGLTVLCVVFALYLPSEPEPPDKWWTGKIYNKDAKPLKNIPRSIVTDEIHSTNGERIGYSVELKNLGSSSLQYLGDFQEVRLSGEWVASGSNGCDLSGPATELKPGKSMNLSIMCRDDDEIERILGAFVEKDSGAFGLVVLVSEY